VAEVVAVDYDAARFWLGSGVLLANSALAIWAWWRSRERASSQALHELSKRIDDNSRRIDLLERDLRDAPGKEQFHDLRESLSGLRAEVRQMTGTMHGLGRAVDLMTEHLINKGSK